MTAVNNSPGELLLIEQGNGATPEVFTTICSINTTRTLDMTATASTAEIADCATPSNPAYTARQIKSYDLKFTGAGVADAVSVQALVSAFQAGSVHNYKVIQNRSGANGGFTITLPMVITSLQLTGERGNVAQTFTITFECAGLPVYTQNA